ncbi:MAG TPA: PIN domain-containing protein [Rhizomicrobium sp.]
MILVDTSVWIDHLFKGDPAMHDLLARRQVVVHGFVIGELAMGNLSDREAIMQFLAIVPSAETATDTEVLSLIEQQNLFGTGIGYIDAHLLAATILTPDCEIWTRDKRLRDVAGRLGLAASGLQ